ncbi:MAG: hypothetical protein IJD75_07870, partial [Clostridia bacterium]|nr:hypothetical protein [Clostridia bacterium]
MKKNSGKRFLSALFALIMVVGMFPIPSMGVSAAVSVSEGLTFKDDDRYTTNSTPAKEPLTFEAELTLGKTSGWMGTIIGNWDHTRTGASFDLGWDKTNGVFPRLMYNKSRVEFKEIDMRDYASNGQYARLIVTIEKNVLDGTMPNNITCYVYVNGELKQQQSVTNKGINITPKSPYIVGYGYYKYDSTNLYSQYIAFSGHIKNIAVYSDVRTEAERAADGKKFSPDSKDANLLLAYNFTTNTPLKDISQNGNDLTNLGDYKYTFAQGAITDRYRMDKELTSAPHTFAAEIKVTDGRCGTIFSDYKSDEIKYISFAVNEDGAPVLKFSTASGGVADIAFSDVNLFTDTFNKVVVTHTDTDVKCYVNGELKQTVSGDFAYHKDVITLPDDNKDTSD